jgi:hypothetical protein
MKCHFRRRWIPGGLEYWNNRFVKSMKDFFHGSIVPELHDSNLSGECSDDDSEEAKKRARRLYAD